MPGWGGSMNPAGSAAVARPRRLRLPLGATLLTLVMVPCLIALGLWQLERREWKHALIARLEAATTLPPVTRGDIERATRDGRSLQYRRAAVDCHPGRRARYDIKGGTSADDQGGFLVLVDCDDPARDRPDLVVVAGWTVRPDAVTTLDLDTRFTGILIDKPYGDAAGRPRFMLIPTSAVAPLRPSRLPTPGDLPDSHLSYALQWFSFAATLSIIYAVYVLKWRRDAKP